MVRIVNARNAMDETGDNRDSYGWAGILYDPQAPYDGSYDLRVSAARKRRNLKKREARLRAKRSAGK